MGEEVDPDKSQSSDSFSVKSSFFHQSSKAHGSHQEPSEPSNSSTVNQTFSSRTDYDKLCLSLLSGLPNEQELALNVCTILSNEGNYMLHLEQTPKLIDLLVAQTGVFPLGDDAIKMLYLESWNNLKGRNMHRFWRSTLDLQNSELMDFLKLDLGDYDPHCKLLNLETELGAHNVEGQRVLRIALILHNLSFEKNNVTPLIASQNFMRFMLLGIHSSWGNLKQVAYDTLSNLACAIKISVERDVCSRIIFRTVVDGILSVDRYMNIRSMDILSQLCQHDSNEDVIPSLLEVEVYEQMVAFLTVRDIMLLFNTLEALYALSDLGRYACDKIVSVHRCIGCLVSLLTLEPTEYGAAGQINMKVVKTLVPADADSEKETGTVVDEAPLSETAVSTNTNTIATTTTTTAIIEHVDAEGFANNWLKSTYEASPGNSVSRNDIYSDYITTCTKTGRKDIVNANVFAEYVKKAFPTCGVKKCESKGIITFHHDGLQKKGLGKMTTLTPKPVVSTPASRVSTTSTPSTPVSCKPPPKTTFNSILKTQLSSAPKTVTTTTLKSPVQVLPQQKVTPSPQPAIPKTIASNVTANPGSSTLIKSLLASKVQQRNLHQTQVVPSNVSKMVIYSPGGSGLSIGPHTTVVRCIRPGIHAVNIASTIRSPLQTCLMSNNGTTRIITNAAPRFMKNAAVIRHALQPQVIKQGIVSTPSPRINGLQRDVQVIEEENFKATTAAASTSQLTQVVQVNTQPNQQVLKNQQIHVNSQPNQQVVQSQQQANTHLNSQVIQSPQIQSNSPKTQQVLQNQKIQVNMQPTQQVIQTQQVKVNTPPLQQVLQTQVQMKQDPIQQILETQQIKVNTHSFQQVLQTQQVQVNTQPTEHVVQNQQIQVNTQPIQQVLQNQQVQVNTQPMQLLQTQQVQIKTDPTQQILQTKQIQVNTQPTHQLSPAQIQQIQRLLQSQPVPVNTQPIQQVLQTQQVQRDTQSIEQILHTQQVQKDTQQALENRQAERDIQAIQQFLQSHQVQSNTQPTQQVLLTQQLQMNSQPKQQILQSQQLNIQQSPQLVQTQVHANSQQLQQLLQNSVNSQHTILSNGDNVQVIRGINVNNDASLNSLPVIQNSELLKLIGSKDLCRSETTSIINSKQSNNETFLKDQSHPIITYENKKDSSLNISVDQTAVQTQKALTSPTSILKAVLSDLDTPPEDIRRQQQQKDILRRAPLLNGLLDKGKLPLQSTVQSNMLFLNGSEPTAMEIVTPKETKSSQFVQLNQNFVIPVSSLNTVISNPQSNLILMPVSSMSSNIGSSQLNSGITVLSSSQLNSSIPILSSSQLNSGIPVISASQLNSGINVISSSQLSSGIPVISSSQLNSGINVISSSQLSSGIPVISSSQLNSGINVISSSQLNSAIPVLSSSQLNSGIPVINSSSLNSGALSSPSVNSTGTAPSTSTSTVQLSVPNPVIASNPGFLSNGSNLMQLCIGQTTLSGTVEVQSDQQGVVRLHIESPENSNQGSDLSSISDITRTLECASKALLKTNAECSTQVSFAGVCETTTAAAVTTTITTTSPSALTRTSQQFFVVTPTLNQPQIQIQQPSFKFHILHSLPKIEESSEMISFQSINVSQSNQIQQTSTETPTFSTATLKRPSSDSSSQLNVPIAKKPCVENKILSESLRVPTSVPCTLDSSSSVKSLQDTKSLVIKSPHTENAEAVSKLTTPKTVVKHVPKIDPANDKGNRTLSGLSSANSNQSHAAPSQAPQKSSAALEFVCEWKNCGLKFQSPSSVFLHASKAHAPLNSNDLVCFWDGCESIKRRRLSHLTHLQDWHCNESVLQNQALRRKQIAHTGKSSIPPPQKPPPHPGYAPDAALLAIKRHALQYINPKELSEEKESVLTKSIRLTSALILRNLVTHSNLARTYMRRFEPDIAYLAMSQVESARTLAQCLSQLYKTHD